VCGAYSARMAEDMAVFLVDYDPSWPVRFEAERQLILAAAGGLVLDVLHVGSTAIPGLPAKPVIDVCALVRSLEDAPACIAALASIEYHYFPYAEDVHPDRRWFCKPNPAARTHHLHLTPRGSGYQRVVLAFRDFLRVHADVAADYCALKQRLAAEFPNDREAYTLGKSQFVQDILRRVEAEQGGRGLAAPSAPRS
jgi:GrpB-like predicted nucleotidyltransferase (UPF0157 family)